VPVDIYEFNLYNDNGYVTEESELTASAAVNSVNLKWDPVTNATDIQSSVPRRIAAHMRRLLLA
jgi:hypothetical protein